MLGLDPEARRQDQPGSELSIPAVMGAQGIQGFNLDCLSLALSKDGRDDVILEGSLAEWEDLCHSVWPQSEVFEGHWILSFGIVV